MEEALILFVLIVLPVVTVVFGLVTSIATFQLFALQRKKLELRRWEIEQKLEHARLASQLPPWLDHTDPRDVAAWRAALKETWSLGRGRELMQN